MINCLQRFFLVYKGSQNIHVKLTFQNVILVRRAHWMALAHLVTEVTQREHLVSGICTKCGYMRSTADEGTVDELLCRKLKQKIFYSTKYTSF